MKSIQINYTPVNGDKLTGKSKWWGQVDMPEHMEHPMIEYNDGGGDDPMTLVCQIRCADLAEFDTENLLPHEGMLYFFADIDDYVGALRRDDSYDDEEEPVDEEEPYDEEDDEDTWYHNGMGEWSPNAFRVIYSPTEENLTNHKVVNSDGTPAYLPAEKITFEEADINYDSFKLLGLPYYDEINQWYPDYINLLQIDENDDWSMIFYDCGMICFLIRPEDLRALDFSKAMVFFHSF